MEPTEFRDHYEKISLRLYRFLLRLTGDRDIADEILQEAACLAYRNRRQYRGDAPFSSWIYRIAINAWKKRAKQAIGDINAPAPGDSLHQRDSRSPEELVSGRQTFQKLRDLIAVLDERYRIPFLLRHVDDLSYREISEILDLSENAARVRIYRARHLLRSMIEEDEF